MNFRIGTLTRARLSEVERAFSDQAQIGKKQLNSDEIEEGLRQLRGSLSNRYIVTWVASTQDGTFVSYLTQSFPKIPGHWIMQFIVTNPSLNLPWDYTKNGLDALWSRAIHLAASHGIHNVLWSLPTAWAKTYIRTQRSSEVWKKLQIHDFGVVNAGELPSVSFDRAVFGSTAKPYDTQLRVAWPAYRAKASHELFDSVRARSALQDSSLQGSSD